MKIIFVVPTEAMNDVTARRSSDADLYLSVGRAVRDCIRHGLPLPLIAQSTQTTIEECLLALQYFESSNGFKLETLVEGWSWSRITEALTTLETKEAHCKLASF